MDSNRQEALPVYCRKSVADVCLNCTKLTCNHGGGTKGCEAYRAAIAAMKDKRFGFKCGPKRRRRGEAT